MVNLTIDIGMVIKLKQTLNERFEKFKYNTQKEKNKTDKENVLDENSIIELILLLF